MIYSLKELSEATAVVAVHLQIEGDFFFGQVVEVHGIQLFLKASGSDAGHDERCRLIVERLLKVFNKIYYAVLYYIIITHIFRLVICKVF